MITIISHLRAALAGPLPGLEAQLRMAPRPRTGWDPLKFPDDARAAAALVLLYPHNDAVKITLTVRGSNMRNHTGQVSLPGGRVEEGEAIEQAAVREAHEEVGVDPRSLEILGRLTPLHIPVSRFILHPVVAVSAARPAFQRAEWEVARIIEAAVELFQDPAAIKRETRTRIVDGQAIDVDVPFYDIDGEKVWGATAMVLAEFSALIARDAAT
jgi:8-oxo-dGTP pyrophosphatase MutT (NUDIX family)